jgi:hypothetical protein
MSKISTYEVVPVPKLADKLIGTSVGGEIEDITYNFTLLELLNLFIPNIPASGLQGVLDNGNSATQDIILDGTIYTTNLEVTDTAVILNSYLNGDTHILGAVYDVHNSKGIAAQVLTSTGNNVEWITLPPIFTPNLQQVLEVGNTADIDIILDANIEALDINVDTATINNNITIDGTITDGDSSVGTLNQVLSSTGTKVKWVNLPSYSATSPLFLDSITGVFSIQQSDNTHNGYLSYVDWITFNGKQPAGNYITALTGEATATGPGSVAITLSNPAVIGKVLSGLTVTGGSISATDSILSAFGKVQGQLNALVGGVMFKGVWNASTNNPTLTSSVGTQGWYYIVNVAGNTDLNGITDWQVGDWAIFNGSTWNKIDNTDLVTSVNGQTGAVSLTTDNISEGITNLYYTDTRARNSVSATTPLAYNNISGVFSIQSANSSQNGYLSSTDWSTFNSKQNALSGTGLVKSTTGVISYITDNSSNWDIAYDNSIISAAVTGTSVKTLTLNQQDGGTITATWSDANTGLTSVGLSMPSAFSVSNSPLVSNGTIGVTGAGTASQYIRGDGQLATFPASGGGGSSVSYYLNGGTSQGTIGGNPYEEMSRTAVVGTNTDFNINTNGYVANFVTDAGDPALLQIPGGNWNFELFFSASSSGGTPSYYVELYKYDGVVLTLIASNSANPEVITGGTSIDLYVTALAVPQTTLTITDRLAVRVYVTHSGRTITLHTQGTHLCQVITTFSTGISALNGLTAQVQYFATGTAGTDFAINSATATHTFNLPTASATNRGALSTTDWTTFNNKANALSGTNNTVAKFNSSTTIGDSNIKDNGNAVSISTTAGSFGALQVGNYNGNILMNTANTSGGLIFQNSSSSNKLWDFSSYNNDINFNESGVPTPVMTLQSGGNIGINTTTPSKRLDIVGTLGATGIVTLGNLSGSGNRMVIADSSGVLSTQVITTGTVTAVTASSPLASSGGNTPNITIQQSSGSQNGYLSSTDWTTFNNKQASGNYITSLTGEATGTGPGATTVTLNNASVTGKVLTGINITGGTVVDTDSILTGFGKLQNQVNGLIGGTIYQGTWNANTNTPALTSGVGTKGYYYIVSVAGTTNLDGITDWFVGDWAIFDGTAWQQVDNTDAVVSVNGQTGAVSLTTDNIPEGTTNLYYLDSRARASLSFTAGSGAYNSTTGVITIPTNTSQLTNGANFITLASLSGTSPIVYNNTTGNISINQSGTSSSGYLSSTDWNTFNGKQNTITLTTTGTSGAATFISNTLNIPNYGSALSGYVPYTGATTNVDLGAYGLTSTAITANGTLTLLGNIAASKTVSSGSPYSFVVTQNSTNSSDSGDGALYVNHILSGTGTGTELVTRSFIFSSDNQRTGGSVLSNSRVLYLVSSTQSGTTTTNLDQVYIEGGTMSGTVTYNRGVLVKTMQGTNQAAFVATGLTSSNRVHLLLGNYTLPTGAWGIYSGLSDASYLQGNLLLASATDDGVNKLQVTGAAKITGQLTLGSTVTNGTYTYTLPSATGTLALTSALIGYLPLTGGTLTGSLTVGVTSGLNLILDKSTGAYLSFQNGVTIRGSISGNSGADGLNLNYGASHTTALSISSTGTANFSNSLRIQGSTVPVSGSGTELSWDGTNGYLLAFNRTTSSYLPLSVQGSSLSFTGAATFSSTIASGAITSSGNISALGGASGGFLSSTYSAGYNRIWAFGNATPYGLGYYQGGVDYIGFHFGSTASPIFNFYQNGTSSFSGTITAPTFSGALNGNATTATSATSAGTATNLSGAGGSSIQRTSYGTSYSAMYQMRETSGYSGSTDINAAPALGFHWGGVVASSILMESSGRISIRNNPGTAYENFIANIVYASASSRAPIFYDSDDTSYYVDPNGLSTLYRLQVIGNWSGTNPNEGAINIRGAYPSMTFRSTTSNNMWLRHMDGSGTIQHYFANGTDSAAWSIKHSMYTNGDFYSLGSHTAASFIGPLSGTASGNVYARTQSNWNDSTVINNVVGMLAWKNYGNAHVIFDASQGTSPSGGGVSQTNATYAWAASYPTLMGWNGSNTYGVRVDSARVADTAGTAGNITAYSINQNLATSSSPTFSYVYASVFAGTAYDALMYSNNGSSYTQWRISGSKGGFGGISDGYSNVHGIMYDSGGSGGVYREINGRWYWYYNLANVCMGINASSTSSAYGLYVTGNIYTTGTLTQASDVRKKTDIVTIDNALEKVTQMRGVYFTKIGEEEKGRQTGVIAQEMNEILPEVVIHAKDVDEYSVAYGNAIGVLIEAIKELNVKLDEANKQIENLKQ